MLEKRGLVVRWGWACLAVVLGVFQAGLARADVILHAFDWKYTDVTAAAEPIAKAGYRAVLVAPPLKTERTASCAWYQQYQPQDFRVIDGCNGNKQEFVAMIKALGDRQVRVYADIVVNHMANERHNAAEFPGSDALADYRARAAYWREQRLFGDLSKGLFSPQDFHKAKCIQDYQDVGQVQHDRICGEAPDPGLPDLEDTIRDDNWVLDQRKAYINALFALGVRGFRLDAAKHMPNGAIEYFVPKEVADKSHVFAETITWGGSSDSEYKLYLQPYLEKLSASFGAYDFPLLIAMKRAFEPAGHFGNLLADPYRAGNALESRRAVTVAVTHDIPLNGMFNSLLMDVTDEHLANAYLLGRDGGTPLMFDDDSQPPAFGGRWAHTLDDARLVRMIGFHNRMQGKPMQVLFADACGLLWRRAEDGIGAINKCGFEQRIELDTHGRFKWHVTYRDAVTGSDTLRVDGGHFTFRVPARSARLWAADRG
jgi:alpha-amylase